MGDFFHGLRRKVGLVLLAMGVATAGLWIRSQYVSDCLHIILFNNVHRIYTKRDDVGWTEECGTGKFYGSVFTWTQVEPNDLPIFFVVVPIQGGKYIHHGFVHYWPVTTAFTLPAAYLLLSKRRVNPITPRA